MGYTHYWTQKRDLLPEEMTAVGESLRKIIETAKGRTPLSLSDNACGYEENEIVICDWNGEGQPDITTDRIAFNGEGPDLDHESFVIQAVRELPYEGAGADRLGWAFCKTARKPYDAVVVAMLTLLAVDYDFDVSSDGDVAEWEAGVKLAELALGREFANPLVLPILVD